MWTENPTIEICMQISLNSRQLVRRVYEQKDHFEYLFSFIYKINLFIGRKEEISNGYSVSYIAERKEQVGAGHTIKRNVEWFQFMKHENGIRLLGNKPVWNNKNYWLLKEKDSTAFAYKVWNMQLNFRFFTHSKPNRSIGRSQVIEKNDRKLKPTMYGKLLNYWWWTRWTNETTNTHSMLVNTNHNVKYFKRIGEEIKNLLACMEMLLNSMLSMREF